MSKKKSPWYFLQAKQNAQNIPALQDSLSPNRQHIKACAHTMRAAHTYTTLTVRAHCHNILQKGNTELSVAIQTVGSTQVQTISKIISILPGSAYCSHRSFFVCVHVFCKQWEFVVTTKRIKFGHYCHDSFDGGIFYKYRQLARKQNVKACMLYHIVKSERYVL